MHPTLLRWTLAGLLALGVAACYAQARDAREAAGEDERVAALSPSLFAFDQPMPLSLPTLRTEQNEEFAPDRLRGRWSIVFFGFTTCQDVCPTTLQLMSRVASAEGLAVTDGTTQLLFVTVDPKTDSPERLRGHLSVFDARIRGLSGSEEALARFGEAFGAAAGKGQDGLDHSTSLFVVDPDGRLAGILLNPSDPAQILADLDSLGAQYVPSRIAAR
jgi:protein SCO1/2